MSEIEVHHPAPTALSEQMDYARAVSSGTLLPQTYRDNPANVLIAVGLGSAMGLSPAESLYRIDVIQGKPTASAELIAANVRKAGHKLRVRGDEDSCTATIIRKDDPDFEFVVTRDVTWAQGMGLTNKDNYKKQRGTMLQWRAITAVARLACPEALYGVAYTPDEMYDTRPTTATVTATTGVDRMRQALHPAPAAEPGADEPQSDTGDSPEPITAAQLKKLHTMLTKVGITDRTEGLGYYLSVIGREVASSKDLTKQEAIAVIDALERVEFAEGEFVDPADPAGTWAEVVQVAADLGMDAAAVTADFEQTYAMSPKSASTGELRAYLSGLRADGVSA